MARRVVKRRLTASYSADDPERIEVSQSGYGNMVRDLRAAELFRVCSRISGKKRRSLCRLLPASAKRGLASKAPASEFVVYLYIDYVSRACYDGHPCSSRGVFRRRSIGGARCGVLRLRLVTAPREVRGPRPPSTTTWLRGARCTGCGGNAADGSAAPGHKSPRWSAERRASYVISAFTRVLRRTMGRKAPRTRLARRVMCGPRTACAASVRLPVFRH